MKKFNDVVLSITVAIIDFLYRDLPIQRFWVLETIARAPYFAFLSVLHLKESLGLRTEEHYYLMKEHFAQTVNETEHLREMESRGGADRGPRRRPVTGRPRRRGRGGNDARRRACGWHPDRRPGRPGRGRSS